MVKSLRSYDQFINNHLYMINHIYQYSSTYIWLVVSTPLKNMKVNGKDDIPYMKWKIKAMFETTNQISP